MELLNLDILKAIEDDESMIDELKRDEAEEKSEEESLDSDEKILDEIDENELGSDIVIELSVLESS